MKFFLPSLFLLWATTLGSTIVQAAVPTANAHHASISNPSRRLVSNGLYPVGSSLFGTPSFNETGRGSVQFGSSVTLTDDGSRLLVGAPFSDFGENNVTNANGGAVFLYQLDPVTNEWNEENPLWALYGQIGEEIGEHVSMTADGSRVAVRRNNGVDVYDLPTGDKVGTTVSCTNLPNSAAVSLAATGTSLAISCVSPEGSIEIFEWLESEDVVGNMEWTSIATLDGRANGDLFGFAHAFSANGGRLAVGSPNHDVKDKINVGMIQVFDFTGFEAAPWLQFGEDILGGPALGQFGFALDISGDGTTIVGTAPNAPSWDDKEKAGSVVIWKWNAEIGYWGQFGSNVSGNNVNDRLGRCISISSDGTRFAVGSWLYENLRGTVDLYELLPPFDWMRIESVTGDSPGDRLALGRFSVSLSENGRHLAAGTLFARNDAGNDVGRVDVYSTELITAIPTLASPSAAPSTPIPTAKTAMPAPTETPTASLDTPSPTTAVPTVQEYGMVLSKLDWDLEPIETKVRFSRETESDEIVMLYNIHNRDVSVEVFQQDCETKVSDTVIGVTFNAIPSSPARGVLEVRLDVVQDALAGNPIYTSIDNENGLLELCTRVDLLATDGTPVVFHELVHTIRVRMTSGFAITGLELERADATEDKFSVDLEYGITACHCDDLFDCSTGMVTNQNEIVNICVQTSVATLSISEVLSLELSQAGLSHATIANGTAGDFTAVIYSPNGNPQRAVIQTIFISAFFSSDQPVNVTGSGSVTLTFVDNNGISRNLRSSTWLDGRNLQAEGGVDGVQKTEYSVSFAIASDIEETSSAFAIGVSFGFATLIGAWVSALV